MVNTEWKKAIDYSLHIVDEGIKSLGRAYPAAASESGIYAIHDNSDWTEGFWTGMLWLAYEFTKNEIYKDIALYQVDEYYDRIIKKIKVDHHDMGFLYSPSCVAAYKITGSETAKKAALLAADQLCTRFQKKGQFIQAWGEFGVKDNYRLIIDCMLNVPLLFWATEITGDEKYKNIAEAHLQTTSKVIIRDDGSTHHTFFFDPDTGLPLRGETDQGYSDDSIWARGQAWGVYGFALAYRYTRKQEYYEKFIQVTKIFLEHLPSDNIPAWDMIFTDCETQKDTSAAPIVVCGILEMNKLCDIPEDFVKKAKDMMYALQDSCFTTDVEGTNGILKHAVYSLPHDLGVDECNIWGDYYYMEALMRLCFPDWNIYW